MRIVKLTVVLSTLLIPTISVIGTPPNNPDNSTHTFCRGIACGEIEDYELSLIAQLIFLLRGEPSTLRVTRATIVISQEPDRISLELTNPIKHYCMAYYGNITIHFKASIADINLDKDENCNNCTHIVCWGFFGYIHVEQN